MGRWPYPISKAAAQGAGRDGPSAVTDVLVPWQNKIRESLLAQSLAVPLDHGRDTVILNKNRTLKKKQ